MKKKSLDITMHDDKHIAKHAVFKSMQQSAETPLEFGYASASQPKRLTGQYMSKWLTGQ